MRSTSLGQSPATQSQTGFLQNPCSGSYVATYGETNHILHIVQAMHDLLRPYALSIIHDAEPQAKHHIRLAKDTKLNLSRFFSIKLKNCEALETKLHTFLTSALGRGRRSFSNFSLLSPDRAGGDIRWAKEPVITWRRKERSFLPEIEP